MSICQSKFQKDSNVRQVVFKLKFVLQNNKILKNIKTKCNVFLLQKKLIFLKPSFLKIEEICKLEASKSMYELHNHKIKHCYSLKQATEIHKYNTKYSSNSNYFIHQKRTNIDRRSFSFVGPKIWQVVPSNPKFCSFQAFKKNLKLYYLQGYVQDSR